MQEKVPTSTSTVYSVRIEPTKMISVGTRITYQATGDAGQNAQPNMAQHWYTHTSCLRSLGTYGLLIVRVCTLLRSSYSSVRWKDEAPTKLMQKIKIKKKLVVHTKMKSKYAHFGPFLRIFFLRH